MFEGHVGKGLGVRRLRAALYYDALVQRIYLSNALVLPHPLEDGVGVRGATRLRAIIEWRSVGDWLAIGEQLDIGGN